VGILHFLFAWKTHSTSGVLWEILLGVLYLFSGFYLLFHPVAGLASLTLLLAAYLLVKGLMQIVHYFQLQPRHGAGWLLFDGIVSLVLGVMIWRSWPFSSVWVIGALVGISLLFTGVLAADDRADGAADADGALELGEPGAPWPLCVLAMALGVLAQRCVYPRGREFPGLLEKLKHIGFQRNHIMGVAEPGAQDPSAWLSVLRRGVAIVDVIVRHRFQDMHLRLRHSRRIVGIQLESNLASSFLAHIDSLFLRR
jgi:hypothetical protein